MLHEPTHAPSRRRSSVWRRRVLIAGTALIAAAGLAVPGGALAAPGVPEDPTVVYQEDFENVIPPTTPILLDDYTGLAPLGMTYTADPAWISGAACNGIILSGTSSDYPGCGSNSSLRGLADAIGSVNGDPAGENHVLSAFTAANPGPNLVQMETQDHVDVAGGGRFLAFSVDSAAMNCGVSAPLYAFELLDPDGDAGAVPPTDAIPTGPAINGCAVPYETVGSARVKRNFSAQGILFAGDEVGVRLRNANGSGVGNDAAVDNLRILDATPQLEKEFLAEDVALGNPGRLRLMVTNTSDLASKLGWSFTDTLPSGLVVGGPDAHIATDCAGVTGDPDDADVTAGWGSGAVTVTGGLAAGQESCTVEVDVIPESGGAGTFTNSAANITSSTGLDLPTTPATLTFHGPPTATLDGPDDGTKVPLDGVEDAVFSCSVSSGLAVVSCEATVELPGGGTVTLQPGDPLPTDLPGGYTIRVKVVDELGQEFETPPRTYTVFGPPAVTITGPTPGTEIPQGGEVPGGFGCAAAAGVVSCAATVRLPDGTVVPLEDGANLPAGVPGTYTITATVVDDAGQQVTVTRTYVVTPAPVPPVVVPDPPVVVSEGPAVWGPALRVTKRFTRMSLRPGQRTTLRIRVTNRTGRTLRNVRVCERIPAGLRFVSTKPKAKRSNGQYCWTVKTLKPGKYVNRSMVLRATNHEGRVTSRTRGTANGVRAATRNASVRVLAPRKARPGGVTG